MKIKEYVGEVMPDGHLSLPEIIAKDLGLNPHVRVKVIIEKVEPEKDRQPLSNGAKKKAMAIREFIADMGPEDLSERFREKYK